MMEALHSPERTAMHICFVAPNAYDVLSERAAPADFGGAEVQQVLLARGLLRRGHKVTFVTSDRGQSPECMQAGIRIIKTCPRSAGWPGIRFVHPRWTSLCRALARTDADVYYQRAAGSETGQVALWCRCNGRPFIFAAASDTNCDPRLPDLKSWRERCLYRAGLRRASLVLCQTQTQAARFRRDFEMDSRIVPNGAIDPYPAGLPDRCTPPSRNPRLLWIGRASPKKRFDWLLDFAALCPQYAFDVVGMGPSEKPCAAPLIRRAAQLPNVTMHGRQPRAALGRLYECAAALVCTSPVEGFPNTFLEAWSRGIPTVSTVDPDGVISSHRLGAVADSVHGLRDALAELIHLPDAWRQASRRARAFFLEHHSMEVVLNSFESVLDELFASLASRNPTSNSAIESLATH
jgi:glycosyltransferase involved in cell wall biosynthesis